MAVHLEQPLDLYMEMQDPNGDTIDWSCFSSCQIRYAKPSGETGVWNATRENTSQAYVRLTEGLIDEAGIWCLHALAIFTYDTDYPVVGKRYMMEVLNYCEQGV